MELNLESVAKGLFKIIPESMWQEKSADSIEASVQKLVQDLGNIVLGGYLLPKRIEQIQRAVERGEIRCEQCNGEYRRHKEDEKVTLKTLFGETVEIGRNQYYCAGCDTYEYVADRVLGLVSHRITPRLALMTALCGASWSYEVGSAFLEFFLGVRLSASTVRKVTIDPELAPKPLPKDRLDEPPGAVGVDGVLIRGRQEDEWLEMKMASFFSRVEEVSEGRSAAFDASFVAGAMQKWKDFEEPVTREAQRRGLDCSEPIEFLGDGAEGIWTLQQTVFPYAKTRLDKYHGKHKIYQRTDQAYKDNRAKGEHQKKLLKYFDKGQVDMAVEYIQKKMPRDEYKKEAARKLIGYLERHREHIPNYQAIKKEGATVSSGLTEKANDIVVVRRLKDLIMHWTRDGADPVLQQRTAFMNQNSRNRTVPYDVAFGHSFVQ